MVAVLAVSGLESIVLLTPNDDKLRVDIAIQLNRDWRAFAPVLQWLSGPLLRTPKASNMKEQEQTMRNPHGMPVWWTSQSSESSISGDDASSAERV